MDLQHLIIVFRQLQLGYMEPILHCLQVQRVTPKMQLQQPQAAQTAGESL